MARTKNTDEAQVIENEASVPESAEVQAQAAQSTEVQADEVNLADFNDSIEAAITGADSATGEPTEDGVKAVQEEYRKLDGNKAKAAARTAIKEGMKAAVREGQLERAKCLMTLDEKVKAAPAKTSVPREAKKIDPTEAYVANRATLHLAFANLVTPEGLAEDAEAQATAKVEELNGSVAGYIAWLSGDKDTRGEEPEVDPIVKAASKLAVGKKARATGSSGTSRASGYSGPVRSVKSHIASAFAGVESGTFLKVSDIVKHESAEYGSDHPSPGAVSASLKSAKFDVEGVVPESVDGHLGARKA